jgi:hypothetical protein
MSRFRLHRRNGLSESEEEESSNTIGSVGMAIMALGNGAVEAKGSRAPAVDRLHDTSKVFERAEVVAGRTGGLGSAHQEQRKHNKSRQQCPLIKTEELRVDAPSPPAYTPGRPGTLAEVKSGWR